MATQRMECDVVGSVITFTMPNGGTVAFDHSKVSAAIREQAMIHGFRQKIADAAALQWRQKDGSTRAPTWAEKRERMQRVVDNLYANEWKVAGEGGTSVFIQALLEWPKTKAKFADAAAAREWLKKSAEDRKVSPAAIQKNLVATFKDLAAIVDRLQAANVDEDLAAELADELDNL